MKKAVLIITLTLVFISNAWALCPLESNESLCTLPGMESGMPIFQNQKRSSDENKNMSSNTINSSDMGSSFNRTQNQTGIKMQGSLGCQFGNCNKAGTNDFLPNQ